MLCGPNKLSFSQRRHHQISNISNSLRVWFPQRMGAAKEGCAVIIATPVTGYIWIWTNHYRRYQNMDGYKIIMEAGAGVLSKAKLEAQSKWSNDIERVSRWTKWLLIKQLLAQPRSVFYVLCWPSKHHPINHLWLDKDGKKRKWKTKVKAPISENLKSGNSMKSPRVLVESWNFEVFTFFDKE